ncbi:MAG: bifunctional lysine ketoglutarate reductase /saccharopine dehydrogenase family protein [Myxococcota bacterium]|nr:bifunctional lysine ketoglutarate reductase /saccharopine dehydrogenase family protein [Myxococcota bacterium]
MANRVGIRREDKNDWERRVPITPEDAAGLVEKNIDIRVERFQGRVFDDSAYENAKARVTDDVGDCEVILGVKEMPLDYFRPGAAYMFFSHTIKGQSYNMDMLRALVEKKCTLLDYELVRDDIGRRLIFFGRFAGLAGMINTLWTLGKRLRAQGIEGPFDHLRPAHQYADLEAAKAAVTSVGDRIRQVGIPQAIAPLVVGFTGYGNVSQGAQEIFDRLPHTEVAPGDLAAFVAANKDLRNQLVKVVFREMDMVQPRDQSKSFDLLEYYGQPERYASIFEPQLQLLSVIVNCIYWEQKYPKLADAGQLKRLFTNTAKPRLIAVGDISCDVNGSLACTVRDTDPGNPVYIYNPLTHTASDGFDGPGIAVMAVYNLPAEFPKEASAAFSRALTPFIPDLSRVDLKGSFGKADLPKPIKRAIILWQGKFTADYNYMWDFVSKG